MLEGCEGEKCDDFLQDLTDEGGGLETDLLENEKWGNAVAANELEKGMDFDRYEPDRDDYKTEEDIHNSSYLVSSPPVRRSPNKPEVDQVELVLEHPNDQKIQKSCYTCGGVGHRMQKCTRQLKRLGTRSRGQLPLDRDDSPTRWRKTDKEASTSRNRQGLLSFGDPSEERSTHRGTEGNYHEKKRSRMEYGTSERHQSKNTRLPVSLSIHSDYTASGSRSQSRSKSLPSGRNAISSRSRSGSTSSHTRNEKIQPESISRSASPTSLSLSLSLGRPAPSSPNKARISQKDYFVNPSGLEAKEDSFGIENGSSAESIKPEGGVNNGDSNRLDDTNSHYIRGNLCEIKESCQPQSNKIDQNARNSAPEMLTEMKEFKSDELREDTLIPTKDSELQASGRIHAASLTSISFKKICMFPRDFEHFDKIEEDLPPEIYFGSARLWPWEIIYYRRLRKGSISKDNYARRLSQNEEFGIVDKYIRSSSGWGELTDETP